MLAEEPSNLYKVLKLLETKTFPLRESDINFLKKRKLDHLITACQEEYFLNLKTKYEVENYLDTSLSSPLYSILQKLENNIRLEAFEVVWLQEFEVVWLQEFEIVWLQDKRGESSLFSRKIRLTYHQIEAEFYEADYQQTHNKWNLPSISSHWRKAEQPQRALQATEQIKLNTIQDHKLKSAILTTRGGAYRDLSQYDQAENCAKQAITEQPNSHHPYTLMGAICYDTGRYNEGHSWFEKALERGATLRDIDNELKRIIEKANEQDRIKVIHFLMEKDPQHYAWLKQKYLSPSKNKRSTIPQNSRVI